MTGAQASTYLERPQVEIQVDLAAAERHQMKPGDVRRAATTLLSGLLVGNLYEQQKVFEVVVWAEPELRDSLTDVEDLLIDTPGGQVRLGDMAEVRIAPTPVIIRRDAVQRFVDVAVMVSGRSLSAVAADIDNRLGNVEFPLEYHAEILSDALEGEAATQTLLFIIATIAVGVLLLLQASFLSWRPAFLVLLTLPVALAGGTVAVLLGGGALTLGALFGFVTVLGLAVRNAVLMITHFQQLEQVEGEPGGVALVVRGARERLTPILMTTLTLAATLLPFVIAGNIAGNELIYPMAGMILGGLITTTLLDLFILPALYFQLTFHPEPVATGEQDPTKPRFATT